MISPVQNNERNPISEPLSSETGNNPVGSLNNGSRVVNVTVDEKNSYDALVCVKDQITDKYQNLANSCNQKLTYFGAFIHTVFSKETANWLAPNYAKASKELASIHQLKKEIDSHFTELDSIIKTNDLSQPASQSGQFSNSLKSLQEKVDQFLGNEAISPHHAEGVKSHDHFSNGVEQPVDNTNEKVKEESSSTESSSMIPTGKENFSDPGWWKGEGKLSQEEKEISLFKDKELNEAWSDQTNLGENFTCNKQIHEFNFKSSELFVLNPRLASKELKDRYDKINSMVEAFRGLEKEMKRALYNPKTGSTTPYHPATTDSDKLKDFLVLNKNEKISYLILAKRIKSEIPQFINLFTET